MSKEKVALITAGGSGMGAVAARKLAADGYRIAVLSSSGKGEALAKELGGVGVTGSNLVNDDVKRLVDLAMERWGRIDAVVNNVGFARFARIGSIELDHLFDTYDMNVRTAVQVVQAALPGMLAAGWGRIVNVTSLTTLGTPERTPYAAATDRR